MRNTRNASASHEWIKQNDDTNKYAKKELRQMSFLARSRTRFAVFLSTGVLLLIFLVSSSSSQGDTIFSVTSGQRGRGLRNILNYGSKPTAVETVEDSILQDQEIKHSIPQSQTKQEQKVCYSFPDGAAKSKKIEALSTSNDDIKITAIILTYKKHEALARLLPSLLFQELSNFEVIIVDNGCLPETKQVIEDAFAAHDSCSEKQIPHNYLQLCDNPGYAAGNNAGAKLASATSKYILFLNDDIVLSKPEFVQRMIQLAENKKSAAAVGCKLVNAEGNELIEAGSVVFKDGSAAGYGRGRKDANAPEFSYPKPVDYVSGACLLIEKQVFMGYRSGDDFGFDGKTFPNYYEDTDLQMHIQHDLKREIWLQPNSVARHDEHGSFGSE
uniref:Glycosyltransferase 2-like domain-containing protein n=1 Tax=Ditylum brightwellii TaxID=49249 RepID=A0A7S2EV24_9STRA